MVAKKRKSKRQSLQQKYKIVKRTKEHNKRLKKGAITNQHLSKKARDTIPNAWPYKEDLLREIQTAKDRMEATKAAQKEKRREEMMKRRTGMAGSSMDIDTSAVEDSGDAPNLISIADVVTGLGKQPKAKNVGRSDDNDEEVEEEDEDEDDAMTKGVNNKKMGQNSRRAYLKELRGVVERADVILQVLDARDPLGTKSSTVEDMVLANHKKRLVYVLNKADLVPREVLVGWLQYLRQAHPTIPFKSNTQQQKGNLSSGLGKVTKQQSDSLSSNSRAVGGEELIGLLKNYCRVPGATDASTSKSSDSVKSVIAVGIVGFPNVGKSSLINSLLRTRAVGVSPTPGFTKQAQEVILDKHLRLIDSPGIVFADGNDTTTALRNCVNVEELIDVYTPVQGILDKCPAPYLMQLYSIPNFKKTDCMQFLALVARAMGKLKKGGIPNTDAAARSILHDWNNGRIRFYCRVPAINAAKTNTITTSSTKAAAGRKGSAKNASSTSTSSGNSLLDSESKLLTSFSKELDISALKDEDIRVLDDLYGPTQSELREAAESNAVSAASASGAAGGSSTSDLFCVGIDSLGGDVDYAAD
mmetsp:Transcript_30441/g.50961  ORF Transcript_30441/g.50961 Transcript_30441/m.50961 type:complete len:585 (-) Transcript_30441:126-1880(-)